MMLFPPKLFFPAVPVVTSGQDGGVMSIHVLARLHSEMGALVGDAAVAWGLLPDGSFCLGWVARNYSLL